MSSYRFSSRSENNFTGVHPDLVRVARLALARSEIDFCIIEGVRDPIRQKQLYRMGRSKTLNSRHLTGHAIDIAPIINGDIPWHDWQAFVAVADTVLEAASLASVPVNWGGSWAMRDGPHFELCREMYP